MKLFKDLSYTFYLCNRWNNRGGGMATISNENNDHY